MKVAPYLEYEYSDVQWLQQLPSHWRANRLKTAATYCVSNVDKVPADEEQPVRLCNYTDVYYNDYIHPGMGLMETTATPEEIRKFGLRINDIVVTKDSEDWRDIAVPAMVAETAPDLVCGYHLAIIRPRADRLYGPFLLRLFQSSAINQQFQIAASGVTRYGLPKSAIGEAWLPLPPLEEQQTIARFLDAQTARIDTLVAKKRQLIAKLKEKRSALIARTVTRGLPPEAAKAAGLEPNPEMKDSGVEWIGVIPKQWSVVPFKRRARFIEGPGIMAADFLDEGIPLIRISGLSGEFASLEGANYLDPTLVSEKWSHFKAKKGDLLISGSASTGLCCEVDDATAGAIPYTGIIIIRAISDLSTKRFLRWYFQSDQFLVQVSLLKAGSTIQHFGPSHLSRMTIALPRSLDEQEAIANYLDSETSKISRLMTRVDSAIARLTEYRQALITSAVTGKIDVRGFRHARVGGHPEEVAHELA